MRGWTRSAAGGLALAAVTGLGGCGRASDEPVRSADGAPPNVLFVAIDDLNDWIGCLGGHPQARTPNLDRLAERGVLFANAHCPAPLCNPSRVSVLTGVRPSTSGVYLNAQPLRRALADAVTLPEHFRAQGYRVEGGGKVFHGPWPDPRSWDAYFPSQEECRPADLLPDPRPVSGPSYVNDWGPLEAEDALTSDGRVARWAASRLAEGIPEPFFLGVGFFRPHLPLYAPEPYFERFPAASVVLPRVRAGDLDDVPASGRARVHPELGAWLEREGKTREAVAAYLACVAFVDAQVGLVLDALAASPAAANTIVVLWSDQGFHLGEKGQWKKKTLWEEATRAPLVIVDPRPGPGASQRGKRCARPVGLVDLYPTLLELCGLPAPEAQMLEGRSLAPLLGDVEAPWPFPALTTIGPGDHALRDERWRYVRYRDGSEELYDHASDPEEWSNLVADPSRVDPAHAAVIAALRRFLPEHDAPHAPRETQRTLFPRGAGPQRSRGPRAAPEDDED